MSIHKIGSDLVRPPGPKGPSTVGSSSPGDGSDEGRRVSRSDSVEISSEGRVRAALNVEGGRATEAELNSRIGSGFYDQPEVAEEVARRLQESGDLHE